MATLRILLLLVALLIGAAASLSAPKDRFPRESVLPISYQNFIVCSSFVIAPDYVLTADHCLNLPTTNYTVAGRSAIEVLHDPLLDVAVLKVKGLPPLPALKPRLVFMEEYGRVWSYGFPNGSPTLFRLVGEVFNGEAKDAKGVSYVVFKPGAIPGMSGGPIVDANGWVVGMNQMRLDVVDLTISRTMDRIYNSTKEFWKM